MSVAVDASPAGTLNQASFNKRRASEDESELHGDSKRTRYSWYFTLEQESPEQSTDDSESVYTAQEYETEFVRDTSDTSTHTWVSDSDFDDCDMNSVEYEVDTISDSQPFSLSSTSEPDDIVTVELITFCESEGMADDSDNSRVSEPFAPPTSTFKFCLQCKIPKNSSEYPYCVKCYQERKATYYPRPRRKARSTSKSSKKTDEKKKASMSPDSQELVEMDSGIGSSQFELNLGMGQELSLRSRGDVSSTLDSPNSETPTTLESSQNSEELFSQSSELMFSSQGSLAEEHVSASQSRAVVTSFSQSSEFSSSQTSTITMASIATSLPTSQETTDEVDSGVMSNEHSSSQDSLDDEKQASAKDAECTIRTLLKKLHKMEKEGSASSMLCITCLEKKRDSVFNHGKTGHQCCCYKCAKKVCMSNNNRCPMCNRRVSSITKIFLD